MSTIVVGLSGGVDSSVAAYLLKQQGNNVIGMFMLNWEDSDGSGRCNAQADFEDARRVADKIGIPYYTVNYAKEYWDKVFQYFLDEYKNGFTPNPDVLCNREIKFGPFLQHAMAIGADKIATGHYAKLVERDGQFYLYKAKDLNKDQSYFLHQLSQEQLSKTIFPLDEIEKPKVREIAKELGLVTATKKDSTGICFIGERNFRQFMKTFLPAQPGEIRDLNDKVVGHHEGVMYYTIGQRRGLNIGGTADGNGERWFVVSKDVKRNILYVNEGECKEMFSDGLVINNMHWINGTPTEKKFACNIKCRYRQPDQKCEVEVVDDNKVIVHFVEAQRSVALGQYGVLYADDGMCYGGGRIDELVPIANWTKK